MTNCKASFMIIIGDMVVPITGLADFIIETSRDNRVAKACVHGRYRAEAIGDEILDAMKSGDQLATVYLNHDACAVACNGQFRVTSFVVCETKDGISSYRCRIESVGNLEFKH